MTNEQRAEWKAALDTDDEAVIEAVRRKILNQIFTKIMDDDPNYAGSGWTS